MVKTFNVNGKKYLLKDMKHRNGDDKLELIPFNEEEYNLLLDNLIDKIEGVIDKRQWLKQVFSKMPLNRLEQMKKDLEKGAKPKTRKGCYELEVGKSHYTLTD